MFNRNKLVFLIDVDNTLIDNDRFAADLSARLTLDFGSSECNRFWDIYSRLRDQCGYADYLGALQEFGRERKDHNDVLQMSEFLLEYPFEKRLYPHALEVISHLQKMGALAILSDGDVIFQPRKVQRSGLWRAVRGQIMIFVHKEHEAEAIQRRYPASHYVMVDDKPQILASMKKVFGNRITTIFVSQGHYAEEALHAELTPPPDRHIQCIADLIKFNYSDFLISVSSFVNNYKAEHHSEERI